jgi:uncharacterized protein (TIGR02147 family)
MKSLVFEHTDYKEYFYEYLASMPKNGRGQYKKLSEFLRVSTVSVSQIFRGERHLTSEQAYLVTKFLKLDSFETTYFLHMLDYAKASHFELREFYKLRLTKVREEAIRVKGRISKFKELKDSDKAIFYSDASYSKVRLATSLPDTNTVEELSRRLNLPHSRVSSILDFLIEKGLCTIKKDELEIGTQHTLLTADSPFVKNHHVNWRVNSIDKASDLSKKEEVMFTLPMSLSKEAYKEIHKLVLKAIKDTYAIVGPSDDECLAYLGIDLYRV